MQAISTRVIPVAGYIMNVCHLGKGDLESQDQIVNDEFRQSNKHGKQASDERLYTERKEGGRGLKSVKDVYKETRERVACYLTIENNEWLRKVWDNEYDKEQYLLQTEVEEIVRACGKEFDKGYLTIIPQARMGY